MQIDGNWTERTPTKIALHSTICNDIIYTYTYVCMYACVYVYVCMYVCMYVGLYVCMYVYMHVCMYVCMHAVAEICHGAEFGGTEKIFADQDDVTFFSDKISILPAKISDDLFLVIGQVFRIFTDFPDLYFVKCRT